MNEKSRKKVFVITPFGLYNKFSNNIKKIFDINEYEVILPPNYFKFYKTSNPKEALYKEEVEAFYIQAEAEVNCSKNGPLAPEDKKQAIIDKATEKCFENLLKQKFEIAKSGIETSDIVVVLNDKISLSEGERKELKKEINYAKGIGSYVINVNLQNLQEQNDKPLLTDIKDIQNCDAFLCPIHLYPIISGMLNTLGLENARKPYDFKNLKNQITCRIGLDDYKIEIPEEFIKLIKLVNYTAQLYVTKVLKKFSNKDRINHDEKLIDESSRVVAFYDSTSEDVLLDRLIEHASNHGKLVNVIDFNTLFDYYKQSEKEKVKTI